MPQHAHPPGTPISGMRSAFAPAARRSMQKGMMLLKLYDGTSDGCREAFFVVVAVVLLWVGAVPSRSVRNRRSMHPSPPTAECPLFVVVCRATTIIPNGSTIPGPQGWTPHTSRLFVASFFPFTIPSVPTCATGTCRLEISCEIKIKP